MKNLIKLLVVFIFVFWTMSAYSQVTGSGGNPQEPSKSIKTSSSHGLLYLGLSMPTGDFAKEDNGAAKTGFTLGYDYLAGSKYVKFLWNQALSYNSAEYSGSYYDEYGNLYNFSASWGYLTWLENLGIRVQGISGNIDPYGSLVGGFSATILTGDLSDYSIGYGLNFGLGAGVVFKNKFDIGLRYYSSNPKFSPEDSSIDFSFKQKIPTLNLTVGYIF